MAKAKDIDTGQGWESVFDEVFGEVQNKNTSEYIRHCMETAYYAELERLAAQTRKINALPDGMLIQRKESLELVEIKKEGLTKLHRRAMHILESQGVL